MSEKKSIWDALLNVAPYKMYAVTMIASIITMYTITIPMAGITPNVQEAYDYVENLEPGSVVVFQMENSYAYYVSHLPASIAFLRHILTKNIILIVIGTNSDGPLIWNYMLLPEIRDVMDAYDYEYGVNWVNLGYATGKETAVAALGQNVLFQVEDYMGNKLEDMPIMQDIRTGEDFDLWVQGGYQHMWVIRQIYASYGTPFIYLGHEGILGNAPVFVEAGQMTSFVHGWAGAVMYERLIGRPGLATAGSGVVSVLYYSVLVATIIGNIAWFGKKLSGGS